MSGIHETPNTHNIKTKVLTEFSDAPHTSGQKGLFNGAELRLAICVSLRSFPRSLLVTVQVQAVRQTQYTLRTKTRESSVNKSVNKPQVLLVNMVS